MTTSKPKISKPIELLLPDTSLCRVFGRTVSFLTVSLISILVLQLEAQNLVPNPGFELSTCPTDSAQITNATGWFSANDGTPDLFDVCANFGGNPDAAVPVNFAGTQAAFDGNAYAGFWAYGPGDYREYLSIQLGAALIPGETYCIDFKVSLGDNLAQNPISNIGAILSTQNIVTNNGGTALNLQPQVEASGLINSTEDWVSVRGSFVADSVYQFITIGNFRDNLNTTSLLGPGSVADAYYFLDEVSLIHVPNDLQIDLAADFCISDGVTLTASGGFNNYNWFDLSNPTVAISNTSVLNAVVPVSATFFVVSDSLGCQLTDTIEVVNGGTTSINLSPLTTCANSPTHFLLELGDVNASATISWDFYADGFIESTAFGATSFVFDVPGVYPLSISYLNQTCAVDTTFNIIVEEDCDQCLQPSNYVNNPWVEALTSCPILDNSVGLNGVDHWMQPTLGDPDYFHTCRNPDSFNLGVPDNLYGSQQAASGNGYLGFFAFDSNPNNANYREYISIQLLEPLNPDSTYCVSFKLSLSDFSGVALSNIGAFFSENPVNIPTNTVLGFQPQIENSSAPISSKEDWITISGTFTPDQPFSWMTIGNFNDDSNTNWTPLGTGQNGFEQLSYYYADDFSVVPAPRIDLPDTIRACAGTTLSITTNSDLCNYSWIDLNDPSVVIGISNVINIIVADTTEQRYELSTELNGCIFRDTVVIAIDGDPQPLFEIGEACINAPVFFADQSTNIPTDANYLWDFNGDGVTDSQVEGSTSFVYTTPGLYIASLTITSSSGCIGSFLKEIEVLENCSPCSAVNLVSNSGFELRSSCPDSLGQIAYSNGWFSPVDNADYFSACATNDTVGVPGNFYGSAAALSGDSYGGFYAFDSNDFRTYLTTQLSQPMNIGQTYCVSFFVQLADSSILATDNISAYISNSSGFVPFFAEPQINNVSGNYVFNDNWVHISGSLTALSPFQFITIGNFSDNSNTSVVATGLTTSNNFAYYYIDNVSVSPFELEVSEDQIVCEGDSVTLSAQSNLCTFKWVDAADPDVILSTEEELEFVAEQTTTYILTASSESCGSLEREVTVEVVPEPDLGEDISNCFPTDIQLIVDDPGNFHQWFPSTGLSDPNASNPIASVSETTTYIVEVDYGITGNTCRTTDTITIFIDELVPSISADTEICEGQSVQLNSSGGHIFSWFPATGLSDSNVSNPIASPLTTTTYQLTVTDTVSGCTGVASVTITVNPPCDESPPSWVDNDGDDVEEINEEIFVNEFIIIPYPDIFDQDGSEDNHTITITDPANGDITQGSTSFQYLPDTDFTGTDVFFLIVCDELPPVQCDTVVVTIVVAELDNLAPVIQNEPLIINTNPDSLEVLCFDIVDPDGDNFSLSITEQPEFGEAGLVFGAFCVDYEADSDFEGQTSFVIQVCDFKGACNQYTVVVNVDQTGLVLAEDDSFTVPSGQISTLDVLGNDTFDGEPDITIIDGPENGVILPGELNYVPDLGFTGTDQFTYVVCNQQGVCDTATVTITVEEFFNLQDDLATTLVNEPISIDVLTNDFLTDGWSISISAPPLNGSATVNADNTIQYAPSQNYVGLDSLIYEVCHPQYGCYTASLTIEVVPMQPPLALNDTIQAEQGSVVTVPVSNNDSDPLNGPLQVSSFDSILNWEIEIVGNEILITIPAGISGQFNFDYTICNAADLCDTATVIIIVADVCQITIPDVITPGDGNGMNDFFVIENLIECGSFVENQLMIFNRYGNIVFSKENYGSDGEWWNGSWQKNGEPLPSGSYFYVLKTPQLSKKNYLRGAVEVLW